MDMKNVFAILLLSLAMSSCMSVCYQVYEVKSSNMTQKDNSMVYENEDCKVLYNLWAEKGSMSFIFENKTDKDIFIDMSQTFFIKNGYASDYYLNRTFETRSFDALSVGYNYSIAKGVTAPVKEWNDIYLASLANVFGKRVTAQAGISTGVSIKEQEYVCVPANSYKYVVGYTIKPDFFNTCDKKIYNPKTEVTLESYDINNTPLEFKNRIAYSFEENNKTLKFIENSFWLASVKNYSKKAAIEDVKDETRCKGEFEKYYSVFKIGGPNQFYRSYQVKM